MKLKFTINYNTAWGESMHVVISYHSQDGTQRQQNLVMLTEDGQLWTLETAALVSRHHPLSHISYRYQVENADGEVLRQEWDMVPRVYFFDASQNYIFPDQWRDRPLAYHLYSDAYRTTQHAPRGEEVEASRVPLFRRTVLFRVSAPQLQKGQAVAVCGSHPAIGSWNTSRYQLMHYVGNSEWVLSVDALGWLMPIEYKYVVVDTATHALVAWEEGDNRVISDELADGQVLVLYGEPLRLCEASWRLAGVSVPVFALRSEHSYGVGDFGDLRRFVDWAVATGMKVIQLLPVNDTTTDHHWSDSCPYNIVSFFALHPHYIDLEAAGTLRSKTKMTQFMRRRQELNALHYSDYEAVDRVKSEYLRELFDEQGKTVLATKECKAFCEANADWLADYAEYRDEALDYVSFVQYLLHQQLTAAADYAREQGVVLKGDLPIGVHRDSVETSKHPALFHLDAQAGSPPDSFSQHGHNWGFPTYDWNEDLLRMLRLRLSRLSQYFDALRIDHVLGYFRIWEIPVEAIDGVLGHFSPALPLTVDEIEYFGLTFRKELFTKPFINDRIVDRLFGMPSDYFGYMSVYNYTSYGSNGASYPGNLANSYLSWEKNHNWNVGMDLRLFDQVDLTVEYFNKLTTDLLLDASVPSTTGFTSTLMNIGSMVNRGWEIAVGWDILRNKNGWNLSVGANWSHVHNEILSLSEEGESIADTPHVWQAGYPFYQYRTRNYLGVCQEDNYMGNSRLKAGNPMYAEGSWYEKGETADQTVVLKNGTVIEKGGTIPEDTFNYYPTNRNNSSNMILEGMSAIPKGFGGFNLNVGYRGLTLDMAWSYKYGHYIWDEGVEQMENDGYYDFHRNIGKDQLNAWTPTNTNTNVPRRIRDNGQGGYYYSSKYLKKGDFLRLKNLTLSYNLPRGFNSKLGLAGARIYVAGTNLLTFSGLNIDPEIKSSGYYNYSMPAMRTVTLGLDLTF